MARNAQKDIRDRDFACPEAFWRRCRVWTARMPRVARAGAAREPRVRHGRTACVPRVTRRRTASRLGRYPAPCRAGDLKSNRLPFIYWATQHLGRKIGIRTTVLIYSRVSSVSRYRRDPHSHVRCACVSLESPPCEVDADDSQGGRWGNDARQLADAGGEIRTLPMGKRNYLVLPILILASVRNIADGA